eukprot:gene19469-23010_t
MNAAGRIVPQQEGQVVSVNSILSPFNTSFYHNNTDDILYLVPYILRALETDYSKMERRDGDLLFPPPRGSPSL